MPVRRSLLTALALSLIAHGMFLAATGRLWIAMPEEIAFPIEASLAPIPQPSASDRPRPAASQPPPAPRDAEASPAPTLPAPQPEPPAADAPLPETVVAPLPIPAVVPMEAPAPRPVATPEEGASEPVAPVAEAPPKPVRPARPALRSLPGRVEIRYAVQYGEGGFTAGEARYLWESRDGRYNLVSIVEAKGLASLFISGRITQASEGSINAGGLQPDLYTENKGERRQEPARFLWAENRLVLSGNRGSVALLPEAQDLLSFPFQLALTARENEAEFSMAVSNGRKLQTYRFRVIGEERLNLPGRTVETLHLQGIRDAAGTLDVWLDNNAARLPVQVRTLDQKGKQITLVAEEVKLL